jgi:hypothetical protein
VSTPQEYWDACLIKTWRNDGKISDAMSMFKSITGKYPYDYMEPLLRTPRKNVPWTLYMRSFAAQHLEKINTRLWDQLPEKDVLLLKKLQTSSYTTSQTVTNPDRELNNERAKYKRNRIKVGMSTLSYSARNRDTDWNVVKASRTKIRGKA